MKLRHRIGLRRRLGAWQRAMLALLLTATCAVATLETTHATPAAAFAWTTTEPRAFGYQVGDTLTRDVTVRAPDGMVLDESSVPQPGARGNAIELRSVAHASRARTGGREHEFRFVYQVFFSPPQVRTLELPGFKLRFSGLPRGEEARVEAWPITVAPLVPVDASPRRGLGDLRPDVAPPLIDTAPARLRLTGYAIALTALLAWLAHVYIGLPWWRRRHRPFGLAWAALRETGAASLDGLGPRSRNALRLLHEALNQTAGEILFESGIARFVEEHPRFAPLRADLVKFFAQSRRAHFAGVGSDQTATSPASEQGWLVDFCRRCRDAERGSA